MDPDEALERARAGDPEGLARLYRLYSGPVYAYLLAQVPSPQDAEEILGEVFVAAVRELPRTGDAGGFRAWLYRVATNRAIDLARRRARRPEGPLEGLDLRPADDDVEAEALSRADRERLWRAVRALPDDQRRVIALRLTGGLSAAEIAPIVGKRVGAVKALQHRALANLARALGRPYPSRPGERLGG